jgi:hypothetical protein
VLAKAADGMLFFMGSELSSCETVTVRVANDQKNGVRHAGSNAGGNAGGNGWADDYETEEVPIDDYCMRMQGIIEVFERAHGNKNAKAQAEKEAKSGRITRSIGGNEPTGASSSGSGGGGGRENGLMTGGMITPIRHGRGEVLRDYEETSIVLSRSSSANSWGGSSRGGSSTRSSRGTSQLSQNFRRRSPRRQGRQSSKQACLPDAPDMEIKLGFSSTTTHSRRSGLGRSLSQTAPARFATARRSTHSTGMPDAIGEGVSTMQPLTSRRGRSNQAWVQLPSTGNNSLLSTPKATPKGGSCARRSAPPLTIDTKTVPLERTRMGSPKRVSTSPVCTKLHLSVQLPATGKGGR